MAKLLRVVDDFIIEKQAELQLVWKLKLTLGPTVS